MRVEAHIGKVEEVERSRIVAGRCKQKRGGCLTSLVAIFGGDNCEIVRKLRSRRED
jgi:hypothetical protein